LTFDDLVGRNAILWLNGARLGQGCYRSLIYNRIHPFRWDENYRPWMSRNIT